MLSKFVFFETYKQRWFQDKEHYPGMVYNSEIVPIRIAILEYTMEWIQAILKMWPEEQREEIWIELDRSFLTVHSN